MLNLKLISLNLIIAIGMLSTLPVSAAENSSNIPNVWRADRNDNGIISAGERRHARYRYIRIDLNDDSTISRGKHHAKRLRKHADRNHDRHIGPRGRVANHRFINRTDRRF